MVKFKTGTKYWSYMVAPKSAGEYDSVKLEESMMKRLERRTDLPVQ